uniref:Ig-like domain-containing protein n=1 Tax=Paramormyrops kingsleyae TaxID=1676925 RepID=A0A3B3QN36_9TELE
DYTTIMFVYLCFSVFPDTALAVDVVQPSLLMRVELGDNVTLTCFCPEDGSFAVWFKQAVGQKPQLMAKAVDLLSGEFYKEYKNIKRYSLQNAKGSFNLTISNVEPSDSAVYYCATVFLHELCVNIKLDTLFRTVVQQPVSDTVQPGDSVSLQCTIETGSCAGEHSVYWFRYGSGESLPGVIYSHRNRSDECEKSPEAGSPTQSCVYSLPKRNLSLSDAGTYYCAVAMCGEMLFGNGTQLDIDGNTQWGEYIYFCCACIKEEFCFLFPVLLFGSQTYTHTHTHVCARVHNAHYGYRLHPQGALWFIVNLI